MLHCPCWLNATTTLMFTASRWEPSSHPVCSGLSSKKINVPFCFQGTALSKPWWHRKNLYSCFVILIAFNHFPLLSSLRPPFLYFYLSPITFLSAFVLILRALLRRCRFMALQFHKTNNQSGLPTTQIKLLIIKSKLAFSLPPPISLISTLHQLFPCTFPLFPCVSLGPFSLCTHHYFGSSLGNTLWLL